jgi:two-component system, NtrC family, nitrogen regulation sensor histidine kinase NtrY
MLGGGYGLAVILTATGVGLASSPPTTGPIGPASTAILIVLGLNMALILCVAGIVGWRLLELVDARSSDAGARLHLRFVGLFSLAAVAPAVIVALFFGVLVNRGVEGWFSDRVRTVVENSATVARSYVEEQTSYIGDHIVTMAANLNQVAPDMERSPVVFAHFLTGLTEDNGFAAAYVLDRDGRILARAEGPDSPPYLAPPPSTFRATDTGDVSAEQFASADLFRALYRLKAFPDGYLYVARRVDAGIMNHLKETEASLVSYREAAQSQARIQGIFVLSYIETALLVLVAAVWVGIAAANSIAAPVGPGSGGGPRLGGDLTRGSSRRSGRTKSAALSTRFQHDDDDLQAQQAALKAAASGREVAPPVHRDRAVGRQRRGRRPGSVRPDFGHQRAGGNCSPSATTPPPRANP